jgi:hypothetical protein
MCMSSPVALRLPPDVAVIAPKTGTRCVNGVVVVARGARFGGVKHLSIN